MTERSGRHVRRHLALPAAAAALLVGATLLTGCMEVSRLTRPEAPVVLEGSQLPGLTGHAPGQIVAFRHTTVDETRTWTQIPVQIDERKVVPFGSQPANNTTAGTTGTVYGSGSGGPSALQYADPNTWVGADGDATFDDDDELVFMAEDAGGVVPNDAPKEPAGVVPGSGVRVEINQPADQRKGWVYLFRSAGSLTPDAGQDYVDYDFVLTSGNYKTTYKRADGPNPETSRVTTDSYEIRFTDRWMETSWKVLAGSATGVDILDGNKNQFATSTCGRSNYTFLDAEGAFVANIDGPVRAIRSYVGANSGPLTQRTHLLYRDREDVITDLRVHSIPGVMDFLDYSAAASSMTYRSSSVPDGVTIDGIDDDVPATLPSWEAVDGPQGRVVTVGTVESSQSNLLAGTESFYEDRITPAQAECVGDGSYYAASGLWVKTGIANTDPRSSPFETMRAVRRNRFLPPAADGSTVATEAAAWAAELDAPFTTVIVPHQP
jgi:hypothetical protein